MTPGERVVARSHHDAVCRHAVGRVLTLEFIVVRRGPVGLTEALHGLDQPIPADAHEGRQVLRERDPVHADGLERHVRRARRGIDDDALRLRIFVGVLAARGPLPRGLPALTQIEYGIERNTRTGS